MSVHQIRFFVTCTLFLFIFESCVLDTINEEVTLSGKVTDSSGVALGEVLVTVELISDKITTQTSSDGVFSVVVARGGTARITISKEAYTSQTIEMAFTSGTSITINIQMTTLEQDAFFEVNIKSVTVPNTRGSATIQVSSNLDFEAECAEDWINCRLFNNGVIIEYEGNETESERTAVIRLNAEYGFYQEITLTQIAGSMLRLMDYTGNEDRSDFLSGDPFIQFNREVTLISAEASIHGIDLTPQYSNDKQTVFFPKIKIPACEEVTINYEVQSIDNEILKGTFQLKLYNAVTSYSSYGGSKILFMNDNRSLWVRYGDQMYLQYSTDDLSAMHTIPHQQSYGYLFYNSYNNCLYIKRNFDINSYKTDIYNASTGRFVRQLDLSSEQVSYYEGAFGYNGFGLIIVDEDEIYSIDSANNHNCKLFIDRHMQLPGVNGINVCNDGKILFLSSTIVGRTFFTVDVNTEEIKTYDDGLDAEIYSVNYALPGVLWVSDYYKRLSYLNLSTGMKINLPVKHPGWSAVQLMSEDSALPWALTSSFSLINLQSGEEKILEYSSRLDLLNSSSDGRLVVIGSNNKLYLFSAETFIKYNSKMKQIN